VIYSLNPVFAYLLGVAGNTERFYLSKLFAILLTVTGIFFVFYENLSSGSIASPVIIGDIYLILAVLSFSLYLSLGKKVIDRYGALKVTTFAFISGSIAYLPFFLLDLQNLKLENVSFQGLAGLVYLTIIVSYLAYFTWYYSMKSIALSKIATMSNLSPLLTVLFSIIFLSEKISIFFIIGGIITLTGVILMHRISLELN
jgi:drug/metabolite transporter (DMT)-like permease